MTPVPSDPYIADLLSQGARAEGIIAPDGAICPTAVRRARIRRR